MSGVFRWALPVTVGGFCVCLAWPVLASECFPMLKTVNMCTYAQGARKHMSQGLPMSLGNNTTLIAVGAVGATLHLTVQIGVTNSRYKAMMAAGNIDAREVDRGVDSNTQKSICAGDEGYMFVRMGGKVQQIYKSLDGAILHVSTVTSCPKRPPETEIR